MRPLDDKTPTLASPQPRQTTTFPQLPAPLRTDRKELLKNEWLGVIGAVCLLVIYVLTTCMVISRWVPTSATIFKMLICMVPTCKGAHSWWLYNATQLGDQAVGTMTQYPTQSHYPDTELSSSCPILVMPNARLGSNTCQFSKSGLARLGFEFWIFCTGSRRSTYWATEYDYYRCKPRLTQRSRTCGCTAQAQG